jgi:hypothetical protein
MYRLVYQADDSAPTASQPQPLIRLLAAFNEQVAAGGFGRDSGRRLSVMSEHDWVVLRSGYADRRAPRELRDRAAEYP